MEQLCNLDAINQVLYWLFLEFLEGPESLEMIRGLSL
jgi:hypothetical protein